MNLINRDDIKYSNARDMLPTGDFVTRDDIEKIPIARGGCFFCGGQLIWDNDYTFEDYGYKGNGIVHEFHRPKCGADVTYSIPIEVNNE